MGSDVENDAAEGQTGASPASLDHQRTDELRKLALIARETSDSVIITDCNFIITWTNAAASRITGYMAEEMLGRNLLEISKAFSLSPDTALALVHQVAKGERLEAVAWTLKKNGERLLADFEMIPYRNEQGELAAFIGITQDITARALAEQALRESEEHLHDAQELAGLGSWRYFLDTKEVRWSKQLFRAFGRSLTKPPPSFEEFAAYINPEDRSEMLKLIERAMGEGAPYEVTFRVTREDGSIAHLQGRGNVRRDQTGRVIELYGTTQDISGRLQAEQERAELHERLASAQRLESMGLLAGGIAHDFNNLLMGVLMDTSLLERQVSPQTSMADAVENIREATMRMAELVNQLLAYAGRGRFVLERINPSELVLSMVDLWKRNLSPETSLEIDVPKVQAWIEIDSSLLRQVVMNLLLNAADALEGRAGKIIVRTHLDMTNSNPHTWILEVSDSGAGMTDTIRRRMFEPFFTTKKSGRGLGLSTVHGIVQRSNGTIDVQSKSGAGTTIRVRLPLAHIEPAPPPPKPAIVEKPPRPLRILVADDEAMVRRSLRRMLESHGIVVVEVPNGAAALDAFDQCAEPFDIALIDVLMPQKNGYEVLAEARTRGVPTKLVLMSGYNDLSNTGSIKFPNPNPDGVLQKPFSWNDLQVMIQMLRAPRTE